MSFLLLSTWIFFLTDKLGAPFWNFPSSDSSVSLSPRGTNLGFELGWVGALWVWGLRVKGLGPGLDNSLYYVQWGPIEDQSKKAFCHLFLWQFNVLHSEGVIVEFHSFIAKFRRSFWSSLSPPSEFSFSPLLMFKPFLASFFLALC